MIAAIRFFRPCRSVFLAWAMLVGPLAFAQAPPARLPEWKPARIGAEIRDLLRELGDLKEYIHSADAGTITVLTFSGLPACVTLPQPTVLGSSIDEAKLQQLQRALEILDRDLAEGRDTVPLGVQAACLDQPSLAGRLPELSPSEIVASMKRSLRRLGNLSLYLKEPAASGAIVVKTFAHAHSCPTMPPPLREGEAIGKNLFGPVENALARMNRARSEIPPRNEALVGRRAPCLSSSK